MAEENTEAMNGTTEAPMSAPSNGAGRVEKVVPSFRLEQEAARAREAVSLRDEALTKLKGVQEEYEKLQAQYAATRENHAIDLHLIERGFTHKSVQRFFRNEYKAAIAETPADKRASFDQWLTENQDDPLYRVHFQSLEQPETSQKSEPEKQGASLGVHEQEDSLARALAAVLKGNPDRFTGQPASGNETDWSAEEIRKLRAKNGGTLGAAKDQIIAQWRAKGVIK